MRRYRCETVLGFSHVVWSTEGENTRPVFVTLVLTSSA